jgi:hypothetical protein
MWNGGLQPAIRPYMATRFPRTLKKKKRDALAYELSQLETRATQVRQELAALDVNLCEIKFTNDPFTVSAKYAKELRNKETVFKNKTGTKKAIFITLISAQGAWLKFFSCCLVGVLLAPTSSNTIRESKKVRIRWVFPTRRRP